jgi:hypothetical protein
MINLNINRSLYEVVSGIPEHIEFSVDIESTVFYTLDGSIPDEYSMIADGKVYLPSAFGTVIVTAIAVSDNDISDVISQKYSTIMNITKTQHTEFEGIRVLPSDTNELYSLGYDESGNPAQSSSIVLEDLDIVGSKTDYTGMPIKNQKNGLTSKHFINLIKDRQKIAFPERDSPNDNNVFFDPKAKYIEIDGTSREKLEGQIVKIINRPYGNFDPVSRGYNEAKKQSDNVITGNLVRSIYDPSTGLYVSFYYESKDSRWIVSKQITDKKILNISLSSKDRFVFKWIEDRYMTKIY